MKYKAFVCLAIVFICIISVSGCTAGNNPVNNTTDPAVTPVTPANTQAPDTASTHLTGTGQQASSIFTLEQGLAVFSIRHSGSSDFTVWLLDDQGDKVELLADAAGGFNGSKAVGVLLSGNYILDIGADGGWSVDVEQPLLESDQDTPLLLGASGSGDGTDNLSLGDSGSDTHAVYALDKLRESLLGQGAETNRILKQHNSLLEEQNRIIMNENAYLIYIMSGECPDNLGKCRMTDYQPVQEYLKENNEQMVALQKQLDTISAQMSKSP